MKKQFHYIRFLIVFVLLLPAFHSCNFKSEAEVSIKGQTGAVKVEIHAGQDFDAEGVITAETCERYGYGKPIPVASCDVVAAVTRRIPTSDGKWEEVTTVEKHTLEYTVACVPGTKWKLDCSDPVVLQIPDDWTITRATFQGKNGVGGDLLVKVMTPAADAMGTPYLAEPGHQIVVLGFPFGTPEDTYEIDLHWNFRRPGRHRIKAVFAAAMYAEDPQTGELHIDYLPPAAPQEYDFRRVQNTFFVADITAAQFKMQQLSDDEVTKAGLPRAGKRRYLQLSLEGAAAKEILQSSLLLQTDR
jgi:hypothetical protein